MDTEIKDQVKYKLPDGTERWADVVGKAGDKLIMVEVKGECPDTKVVWYLSDVDAFDEVWLAIPNREIEENVERFCEEKGIGLLGVTTGGDYGIVVEAENREVNQEEKSEILESIEEFNGFPALDGEGIENALELLSIKVEEEFRSEFFRKEIRGGRAWRFAPNEFKGDKNYFQKPHITLRACTSLIKNLQLLLYIPHTWIAKIMNNFDDFIRHVRGMVGKGYELHLSGEEKGGYVAFSATMYKCRKQGELPLLKNILGEAKTAYPRCTLEVVYSWDFDNMCPKCGAPVGLGARCSNCGEDSEFLRELSGAFKDLRGLLRRVKEYEAKRGRRPKMKV